MQFGTVVKTIYRSFTFLTKTGIDMEAPISDKARKFLSNPDYAEKIVDAILKEGKKQKPFKRVWDQYGDGFPING